ncbi:hypothetical protein MMC20_002094 [Loxospora ochrophaea]|nr:hypothetical protein [Loxospora ochrophaea]
MPSQLRHTDDYELVQRRSTESNDSFNLDDADFESQSLTHSSRLVHRKHSLPKALLAFVTAHVKQYFSRPRGRFGKPRASRRRTQCSRRSTIKRLCLIFQAFLGIILALVVFAAIFRPSYTRLPPHYAKLTARVANSNEKGRANLNNEKVFIAASIYDEGGKLANGAWGQALLDLVDLLGDDNVFLSIYESDSGLEAKDALHTFEAKLSCNHKLHFDQAIPLDELPKITLPDGAERVKRIAYLAEVRNRALLPLDQPANVTYDKLLFLNDVVFYPMEAAQLLFSTNLMAGKNESYRAACAVDFINPFKFYDTFATRDLEGYGMGLPFYPWFSAAGDARSREDVFAQKDAVRVRSCWGGMVAFDARWFQARKADAEPPPEDVPEGEAPEGDTVEGDGQEEKASRDISDPIRFRAEPDLYWDASECCLIQADLQNAGEPEEINEDTGIYLNPFVRVAYDSRTLWWLRLTRRFERVYSAPHSLLNRLIGLPWFNPRREEKIGEESIERIWVPDAEVKNGGTYQLRKNVASGGGFCGIKTLQVIKEEFQEGEKNWETLPLPPG